MMNFVVCQQEKPLKAKIVSIVFFIGVLLVLLIDGEPFLFKIVFLVFSIFFFGYRITYKITNDFTNYKYISIFGFTLIRMKLRIEFPDYISVFATQLKVDNEWGAIAAMGTQEKHDKIVVRFFKGNSKFTVFRTNNYEDAIKKAKELSALLNIKINDVVKN